MAKGAEFIKSAAKVEQLPNQQRPEFAFIGRSNVGKSSVLGALMRAPKMVRTSRTPGRTQLLNYFHFSEMALVDLPGYGYAKLSKTQRSFLSQLIASYLDQRTSLLGVVLIIDARRESWMPADSEMLNYLRETDRPVMVIANKVDTLSKSKRKNRLAKLEREMELELGSILGVSAKEGLGIEDLRKVLRSAVES